MKTTAAIAAVLALLLAQDVRRLPVVDHDGRVVGEVGIRQVLAASSQSDTAEAGGEN